MTPDIITAVPYLTQNKTITELIQKLLTGRTIEIPTSVRSIKLKYKNKKSVLIFCKRDKSPDSLKQFCQFKKIHVYEAVWTGFSTDREPPLSPLLSDSCQNKTSEDFIDLTEPEIIPVQWMLFLAKYHTAKYAFPKKLAPEEVLTKFLDKFCVITGEYEDRFPSQEFYNRWVLDYYQQNDCTPIGYKCFNRFLKSYDEGQLYVKAIHRSTGDNVQHIIGLKFLDTKYEKMKSEKGSRDTKIQKNFRAKLTELFRITEKEVQTIYQNIMNL